MFVAESGQLNGEGVHETFELTILEINCSQHNECCSERKKEIYHKIIFIYSLPSLLFLKILSCCFNTILFHFFGCFFLVFLFVFFCFIINILNICFHVMHFVLDFMHTLRHENKVYYYYYYKYIHKDTMYNSS